MAEGGNTATLLAAKASYKKIEGYLYLTDQPFRIVWVNGQTNEIPVQLFSTECTSKDHNIMLLLFLLIPLLFNRSICQ
jgi:hypothetical protein